MERVIFLYEKDSTDVFAFFPDEMYCDETFLCYKSEPGYHYGCALDYAKECEEAKVGDILPLHYELTQMTYNLKTTSKNALFWL